MHNSNNRDADGHQHSHSQARTHILFAFSANDLRRTAITVYSTRRPLTLMVQVKYDKKADAPYIWAHKGKYDISEELAENVTLDLYKTGRIIGIEVRDTSKNIGQEPVTKIITTEKIAPTA